VPVLPGAGAGGPTRRAIAYAQEAERLGAAGVLLLPHYLTEAPPEGIARHVELVCKSVKAGARIVGRDAGPVRSPLTDLTAGESDRLSTLIASLGPQ